MEAARPQVSLTQFIKQLPNDLCTNIFEYDDTYRVIFVNNVFPLYLSNVWRKWEDQFISCHRHVTTCAKDNVLGEYERFSQHRELLYCRVLLAFMNLYYRERMLYAPPDTCFITMYHYNETVPILENEEFCGRFHIDWESHPNLSFPLGEMLHGFVIHLSEFEKGYVLADTEISAYLSFSSAPLVVSIDGMCDDPRLFQWSGSDAFLYSVVFVQDNVLILLEQDVDEP